MKTKFLLNRMVASGDLRIFITNIIFLHIHIKLVVPGNASLYHRISLKISHEIYFIYQYLWEYNIFVLPLTLVHLAE